MTTDNKPLYTFYRQWGNKIYFKYRKNGNSYAKMIDFYKPSLYIRDENATDAKSIFGYPLRQKQFDTIREAKEFAEQYKNVAGMTVEGNSNFAQQFITEFYEGKMPEFTFDDIRMGILDIEVRCEQGFPEPAEANWPINGITFYDSFTKTYYVFGDKDYVHDKSCEYTGKLNVQFTRCRDEIDLLDKMLTHFLDFQYDVTSGWNSETFDMPYIVNRCYKILGKKRTDNSLSPFGNIRVKEFTSDFGKDMIAVDIAGLPHVDYSELYKKHNSEPRESFRLDHIASEELGRNKVTYEEEGSLNALYDTNPQLFYTYNIVDVDIVKCLEDKLGFMYITYILAYYTMSNYTDTLKTVKPWENLIAKHLHLTGRVPPYHRKHNNGKDEQYEGAFVHPTQVGFWKWVLAIDLNSLYPMNEIQYGIGPETHVPVEQLPDELKRLKATGSIEKLISKEMDLSVLKKYPYAMTANFEFYDKRMSSCIAEIKESLYTDRKAYKKKMLNQKAEAQEYKESDKEKYQRLMVLSVLNKNIQQCLKILLNGGYGAVGNSGFLYFKIENAEAITLSGQLINKWTHTRLNGLLNKICGTTGINFALAGDTDSLYLCLDKVVEKAGISHLSDNEITDWLDKFHKTVMDPAIVKWTEELADYMNAVKNKMVWGREAIASSAIFVRKKGYAMRVIDSEGVRFAEPEIKIVGLEAIKAGAFPGWARKYLKECYEIALTGSEAALQKKVAEIEKDFMLLDVSTIATPRGVSSPSKYYDPETIYIKGTPKHVKAALVHNWMIDKMGLTNIQKITDGSKIKYIELKRPNPIEQDVIGFNWFFPAEFGLDKYVDRRSIFESSFIDPLNIFLSAVKWSHEEVVSLEDFFG